MAYTPTGAPGSVAKTIRDVPAVFERDNPVLGVALERRLKAQYNQSATEHVRALSGDDSLRFELRARWKQRELESLARRHANSIKRTAAKRRLR